MRIPAITLALLLVASSPPAEEAQALKGPLAVLGLAPHQGAADRVAGFAQEIQEELVSSNQVEVYNPAMLSQLLTGDGPTISSRENLERLKGIFQQGYLQSYSFEYRKALNTLHRVLDGLDRLPPSPGRWELWIKAKLFQGISLLGLEQEGPALKSFAAVLRTRPGFELSRKEYSPKTIQLFKKAAKRLAALPTGSLAVQTDPPGAQVFLDGHPVGKTPFIGRYPHGQYHLQVQHQKAGGAVRWVRLTEKPARVRLQLSFEGALVLQSIHPCVRLPQSAQRLPEQWWPWLGDRLGLRLLVAVRHYQEDKRPYLSAALVDLERGLRIREASLELPDDSNGKLGQNAKALSDFLITGKTIPALQVKQLSTAAKPDPLGTRVPDLPAQYAPRPWTRKWWPYLTAAGILAGGGLGAHLASDHYQRKADQSGGVVQQKENQDSADSWLAVAISGYALAGAALITGLILRATYDPVEVFEGSSLIPAFDQRGIGAMYRFNW